MFKAAREKMFKVILNASSVLTFLAFVLLSVGIVWAAEIPEPLTKKLAEFSGAERGQVIPVEDESLSHALPGCSFYVLRFKQFPVAVLPPEPLKANNLFIVKPDRSVERIADAAMLKKVFQATLAPVQTEAGARDAARAWLRLAEELHQDGFFQFSIPDKSIRVAKTANGGLQVSGRAVVSPQGGNTGAISASLAFDGAGALAEASESAQIRPGIRPICQATKLLDPNPIVRGMAEQSILVMGKAAKDYLEEQRAKAVPALQHAIDKIWQRIVTEGR